MLNKCKYAKWNTHMAETRFLLNHLNLLCKNLQDTCTRLRFRVCVCVQSYGCGRDGERDACHC